jgi:hypothetical protein
MNGDAIERWHAYMRAPDPATLDALIDADCVFESPAVQTPQVGKALTLKYLTAAASVLGNDSFRYVGEWRGSTSAVLEFNCELVDGIKVDGVDIIGWNEAGRITSFKVMIRPIKALHAVMPLMATALAAG